MNRLPNNFALGRKIAAGFAFLVLTAATSQGGFITFESAGANAAAVTPTRDAFRAAVGGGTVAGANGSFGGLRREVNWDVVAMDDFLFAEPVRATPEPSTFVMASILLGLGGVAYMRKHRIYTSPSDRRPVRRRACGSDPTPSS